ncbi:hypothetical protein NliqN6_3890 [Naganishia liquefaciens]|uniref:Uncharacterized protein n=1 Tax=Naganishia liquefaciens TaxID=104408 RepID=A0A8H3YFP5_9TREE|nr:hypothetical protein NliqN6_3890 [Naganishia liquefaciens]
MPSLAPNTISPQQGGIAGTTVGNVPGTANIGLGTGEAPDLTPKQSVVGDPEVLAGSKIEPLDKQAGEGTFCGRVGRGAGDANAWNAAAPTKDAQKILDQLADSVTSQSPAEALSSAQATVTEALGNAATAAQGLASQAYEAVVGSGEKK